MLYLTSTSVHVSAQQQQKQKQEQEQQEDSVGEESERERQQQQQQQQQHQQQRPTTAQQREATLLVNQHTRFVSLVPSLVKTKRTTASVCVFCCLFSQSYDAMQCNVM
jgi:hypothetical protein